MHEWADLLAQAEQTEFERKKRQRDRVRERASAEDLRRMEIVFGWLSDLAKLDDGLCRAVQRWARLRSTGRSVKGWCGKTGLSFHLLPATGQGRAEDTNHHQKQIRLVIIKRTSPSSTQAIRKRYKSGANTKHNEPDLI